MRPGDDLLLRYGYPKAMLEKHPPKRMEEGSYDLPAPKDGKMFLEGVISRNAADLRYWGYAAFNAADVRSMLGKLDGDGVFHLNSGGGDPTEASACAHALLEYMGKADESAAKGMLTCFVTGIAGSAATYVMLASDRVKIMATGEIFIHRAHGCFCGNSEDLRAAADGLDTTSSQAAGIYAQKTGKSEDDMLAEMVDEKYYSAKQSLEIGFVDEVVELVQNQQGDPDPAPSGDMLMREFVSKTMDLRSMGVL
ncbi:MAG: Clp protease ClpP [Bryobacterales bacterium]|nr:Clp protease ClpP [Bryobacterales bacterium]